MKVISIAIIGSRGFNNYKLLKNKLDRIIDSYNFNNTDVRIISGGARGADILGRKYSKENDFFIMEFLPEYEKYGRKAPLIRNTDIIYQADIVVAFWDGESKGTIHAINLAKKKDKKVHLVMYKEY